MSLRKSKGLSWEFLGVNGLGPSAPLPKFVIHSGTLSHELRKQRGTSKVMILVPLFDLKFLKRDCRTWGRNFKSAALASFRACLSSRCDSSRRPQSFNAAAAQCAPNDSGHAQSYRRTRREARSIRQRRGSGYPAARVERYSCRRRAVQQDLPQFDGCAAAFA